MVGACIVCVGKVKKKGKWFHLNILFQLWLSYFNRGHWALLLSTMIHISLRVLKVFFCIVQFEGLKTITTGCCPLSLLTSLPPHHLHNHNHNHHHLHHHNHNHPPPCQYQYKLQHHPLNPQPISQLSMSPIWWISFILCRWNISHHCGKG